MKKIAVSVMITVFALIILGGCGRRSNDADMVADMSVSSSVYVEDQGASLE